ncbi:MAG TPA: hypothetical protein VIY09_07780, partial [Rhizomicrobium sp.]
MSNAAERIDRESSPPGGARQRWNSFVTVLRASRGSGAADDVLPFLRTHRVVWAGASIVALFFFGFVGWAAV